MVFSAAFAEDTWPQFRGSAMNPALEDNPNLPETWSTTENVEWATDIPGLGWSSPVVWGNKVFLTTVDAAGNFEQPKDGLYNGRGRPIPLDMEHGWVVYCLELESGDVLWKRQVRTGKPVVSRHPKATYASETPTTDGQRVYFLFGDVALYCFDMEGNELWNHEITPYRTKYDYGAAASPILYDDKVIMIYDNLESSYIAAYNKVTGEEMWRTERNETMSWATPYIWENEQRTEIITTGKNRVRSYDLNGNLIWEMDGRNSWACIPSPFASDGLLYVDSGYVGDEHRPVYAIRPGATGDITMAEGQTSSEFVAWYQPEAGNYNTSPLVYRGLYYSVLDRGGFECYDAKTGDQVYSQKKIVDKGRTTFTASPWAYNGKVFSLSEQGNTYVVEAGPNFKLLHQNSLDELCIACPAIVGDRVIIRTVSKLYSIKKM
jgi:outer membrane protein assembly factor BamB